MNNKGHIYETIHSMDGMVHPCPYCGGEFHLIHEKYFNRNGYEVNCYYWEEDPDIDCLMYEIECKPFKMGAGDVRIDEGYIGEFARRWNEHFEKEERNERSRL